MEYICHRRFKGTAICGSVNIPAQTTLEERDGYLYHAGQKICVARSETGKRHFAIDDDGCGMERGKLARHIMDTLAKPDKLHQSRWDKVWADDLCRKYKLPRDKDYWLWNDEFYTAPIEDLKYIYDLVKR